MKTQELFEILQNNKDKALLFQYAPNKFVGTNYHITEVKHVQIDSVDCGAQRDAWNETIIQLWESPSEIGKIEYMSVFKALGILNKVGSMKAFDMSSEVKFEYGNDSFHTTQLYVNRVIVEDNELIVLLNVQKTDCKAKELCGVPEPSLETAESGCCTPESGCC